jgi:hypothetical protein
MLRMEQEYAVPFGDVSLSICCVTCQTVITVKLVGKEPYPQELRCPICGESFASVLRPTIELMRSVRALATVLKGKKLEAAFRFRAEPRVTNAKDKIED